MHQGTRETGGVWAGCKGWKRAREWAGCGVNRDGWAGRGWVLVRGVTSTQLSQTLQWEHRGGR